MPEGFIIKGKDNRRKIINQMESFPYQSLIMLYGVNCTNKFYIGTAFQINAEFAITAAHNLWDKEACREVNKTKIKLFPAAWGILHVTEKKPNEVGIVEFRFPPEYPKKIKETRMKGQDPRAFINHFDFALIKLSKPIEQAKYLTLCSELPHYKDLTFEVAGCPGDVST